MTDPTLLKGTGVPQGTSIPAIFATSSSRTLTLYNTQSESFAKNSNLTKMPLPGTNSDQTIEFDLFGCNREITVRGTFIETTAPLDVLDFTTDLNNLIFGSQGNTGASGTPQVGYIYTPVSHAFTIRVFIDSIDFSYDAGAPTKLEYTIKMTEVSSSSA